MNTWWPPRGYSDTLRERRMSVWGTRRIFAFTDIYAGASHSDDPNNSRFVSGYLYVFAGGPVTWSSKKQPVVALSSCESEYIALTYSSQEAVYLSFVEWINVSPVFFCADVRGQHGISSAIRYYSILVKDPTHLYETPFSARAGFIEQDHRISCQDNRSDGGHFHQILGPPEV